MSYLAMFFAFLISVYTVIFGVEIWKKKNRSGAVGVFILAITVAVLPFYALFIRE